jgi:hypothetical protein
MVKYDFRLLTNNFLILSKIAIESTLKDYIRNTTTIHGLNYTADRKPNWLDR